MSTGANLWEKSEKCEQQDSEERKRHNRRVRDWCGDDEMFFFCFVVFFLKFNTVIKSDLCQNLLWIFFWVFTEKWSAWGFFRNSLDGGKKGTWTFRTSLAGSTPGHPLVWKDLRSAFWAKYNWYTLRKNNLSPKTGTIWNGHFIFQPSIFRRPLSSFSINRSIGTVKCSFHVSIHV